MGRVYRQVLEFKKRYPTTIAWRLKKHSAVVELHLNPDEEALYTCCGQKNDTFLDVFGSAVTFATFSFIGLPFESTCGGNGAAACCACVAGAGCCAAC